MNYSFYLKNMNEVCTIVSEREWNEESLVHNVNLYFHHFRPITFTKRYLQNAAEATDDRALTNYILTLYYTLRGESAMH